MFQIERLGIHYHVFSCSLGSRVDARTEGTSGSCEVSFVGEGEEATCTGGATRVEIGENVGKATGSNDGVVEGCGWVRGLM